MAFPYKKVYLDSWRLVWQNRILWALAIFVGGTSFVWQAIFDSQSSDYAVFDWSQLSRLFTTASTSSRVVAALFIGVAVALTIAIFLFAMLCKAGVIKGTSVAHDDGVVRFGASLRFALSRFWDLLGLELIFLIPNLVLLALYFGVFNVWYNLFAWLTFLIVIILYNLFVYFFEHYAYCFVVLEQASPWKALVAGWRLMTVHFRETFFVNVLRVLTLLAFTLVNMIVAVLVAIPFAIIGFVNFLAQGNLSGAIFGVGALFVVGALILVKGFTSSYLSVIMTRTYWEIK
jgi:hypothetical protein